MMLSRWVDEAIETVPWMQSPQESYDVIVVGLGTAGAIAAIAAGRLGLSVLGIERQNCMGGTATAGAVKGYYFGLKGGQFEQIDEKVRGMVSDGYVPTDGNHPELKKYVLEKEARSAGVTLIYESTVTGVLAENQKAMGIQYLTGSGLHTAAACVVIDATAEAAVCAMAGCETRRGRALDHKAQPYSNAATGIHHRQLSVSHTDNGYVEQHRGKSLSRAIIESAAMSCPLRDRYEADHPMMAVAPLLGIREGRCIVGEEDLTLEDHLDDRVADQPLFYAYSNVDNHGKDLAFESEIQQDWVVVAGMWGTNFTVPVPLGALIPRGWDGILAAGRHIAVDHDLASVIRMERGMQKCGEAAAAVAFVAIRKSVPLRAVAYEQIQPLLKRHGCLDDTAPVGMKDVRSKDDAENAAQSWRTDKAVIRKELASHRPGFAIWSAKRMADDIRGDLRNWMNEDDEQLCRHSALALGLIGDPAALPVLRRMVRERDGYVPETSRKYNQMRGISALYLLGKLADAQMIDELICIVSSPDEFDDIDCMPDEFIANGEELYFQYFSHSMMALIRIGTAHPQFRERIAQALKNRISDPHFEAAIALKGLGIRCDMTDTIRGILRHSLEQWGIDVLD